MTNKQRQRLESLVAENHDYVYVDADERASIESALDRIAELEAECKRLSKLLSDKYLPSGMCVLERLVELTEENARLREALQAMYDLHPPSMFINFRDVDDWKKTLEQVGALLRREATDGTPDRAS